MRQAYFDVDWYITMMCIFCFNSFSADVDKREFPTTTGSMSAIFEDLRYFSVSFVNELYT